MTFLPIVTRELGVVARRPGTYRLRALAALSVLLAWFCLFASSENITPIRMGQHLLNASGVLALAFSMVAGLLVTADCLSEEKREGTLGLLFLTDLKAYDIVLGKLTACSLHTFFGLLAVLPILGLSLLLGGVTGAEFWRLTLVFTVTLFFSLGLGMLASAVSHDGKQALARAFFLLLILSGVSPGIWFIQSKLWRALPVDFLLLPSPVYAYLKAFETQYRFGSRGSGYWLSLGVIGGAGLLAILLAAIILPRVWKQSAEAKAEATPARGSRIPPVIGAVFSRSLLNQNPMYWLMARDLSAQRLAKRVLMLIIPFFGVCLLISIAGSGRATVVPAFIATLIAAFVMHMVIKLLIASEASRKIYRDRQSGALELLLVTPVDVPQILSGHRDAIISLFAVPKAILLAVNLILGMIVLGFNKQLEMSSEYWLFLELFAGGAMALAADFYALTWLGMWRGLTARKPHRALVATAGQVLGISWLLIFLLMFSQPHIGSKFAVGGVFAVYYALGILISVIGGSVARARLVAYFRQAAARE